MQQTYRVCQPEVVADIVDGEAVIMNLKTGKYFSSEGIGSYCWGALAARYSVEQIVERLAQASDADRGEITAAVEGFVAELVRHELLAPANSGVVETDPLPAPPAGPFKAPVVYVYSDMQDLLMLDPIHDVDAAGWPMPKTEALI